MRFQSALMLSVLPFQEGHITFDEAGSLTGAAPYTHCTINTDLASLWKANTDV